MSDNISLTDALRIIQDKARSEIATIDGLDDIEIARVGFLGRKGAVTMILKGLKDLSDEEKRVFGPEAQALKNEITELLNARTRVIQEKAFEQLGDTEWIDATEPGAVPARGHFHPLLQTLTEVEDAFISLGFSIVQTPELESDYYNFEALNVAKHHPARDMQDTFWLDNGHLLRTHTTSFQARSIEQYGVPLRVVQAGKVYRYEATDASHDTTFYQVDGLLIDEGITVSHMMGVITSVLTAVFHKPVTVRLRPGYFPFVEPGMELDFQCLLCAGTGCRVCKHTGWLEFMGCGMVHPNVLRNAQLDPAKTQGFAFGFGLSRLVMMRHAITDVRYLMSGDVRFLQQF